MNHPHFDQEFARLNPQQKEAVCIGTGPALVIAGAGSGKTRVATMRVAHLIRTGICPSSIVAVTFTNKAAKEMRERVHHLVGSEVLVSTFHSLGAKILRESIHLLEYPTNFAIYDEEETEKLLKGCLKARGLICKDKEAREFRNCFSKIKNKPSSRKSFDSLTCSLFDQYQTQLHQSGAVDFDDLLYLPLQLFQKFPTILQIYTQKWTYLLVDEYQDTCENQSLFASLLAGPTHNIFAVGDPDQSIYSWRGANVANILSFQDTFPNATIIRLDQNYRSTNTILGASNAVIKINSSRFEKDLWSERGNGEPICRYIAKTERQEAEYVSNRIREQSAPYDQIAILYRTNAQSRSFEDKLIEERIPYRIWGGTPFYSRREVKDVLSLLQLASLPQDTAAFNRAIQAIGHGIGEVTLTKIHKAAAEQASFVLVAAQDLLQSEGELTKRQRQGLTEFCQTISTLRQKLDGGSVSELISSAIQDTGYLSSLQNDPETFQERKENLEQLIGRAQEWEEQHAGTPPSVFLQELFLEGAREHRKQDGPAVTLATIHNAKGLEFAVVFVVGLEEDLFPHINSKSREEAIEEERRLFYVAMTRAKDSLFLTASQTRHLFGGLHHMRLSRFLQEVPIRYIASNVVTAKTPSQTATQFSVGQIVLHPTFGVGRIEGLVETSAGSAYEVFFSKDQAKRKILIAHSPMNPISRT